MSLDLITGIKKTFFPPCGMYGNQLHASLDPKYLTKLNLLKNRPAQLSKEQQHTAIKDLKAAREGGIEYILSLSKDRAAACFRLLHKNKLKMHYSR